MRERRIPTGPQHCISARLHSARVTLNPVTLNEITDRSRVENVRRKSIDHVDPVPEATVFLRR